MNTYKPSGKYSPLSPIYLVLTCATVVPALAWLYAYAIWYCPFIYINFFITLGFGAFVGYRSGKGSQSGNSDLFWNDCRCLGLVPSLGNLD